MYHPSECSAGQESGSNSQAEVPEGCASIRGELAWALLITDSVVRPSYSGFLRATQVLSDPKARKNYDYALAHPEETLYNEYQYYYARYEKYWRTDPKLVVLGFLAVVSLIQYASRHAAYSQVCLAPICDVAQ